MITYSKTAYIFKLLKNKKIKKNYKYLFAMHYPMYAFDLMVTTQVGLFKQKV